MTNDISGVSDVNVGGEPTAPITEQAPSAHKRSKVDWLWADGRAKAASIFMLLVILLAIFAPLVARHAPDVQSSAMLKGPSGTHWLGTDDVGRDVWARLVYGARVSLQAGLIAVAVAVVIGIPIGLVAGYASGWTDNILMRAVDTLLAFPAIVLAIGITAALGRGLVNAMVAVGIVFSPGIARITRTQVQLVKDRLYVEAAVGFGSSTWRTMRKHIVPNMVGPVIVQATFVFGLALLAEASLSFLGLGVQAPTSSWGSMLRRSSQFLAQSPNAIYVPGLAIALTVLSCNVLGDALRDAVDPTTSSRRRLRRAKRTTASAPTRDAA